MGTSDTADGNLGNIKTDCRALEDIFSDVGAQLLFSVLQGKGGLQGYCTSVFGYRAAGGN